MRARLGLVSVSLVALLAGLLTAPAAVASDPNPTQESAARESTAPGPARSSAAAAAALAHVQALLSPAASAYATRRSGAVQGGGDLTMALRDLRMLRDELDAQDAASARTILARPAARRSRTFGTVKVHWASTSSARPAYIAKVGKLARKTLKKYRRAGYRAPKSDGGRGGGKGLVDIYLEDLEPSLYGYCDTDEPPTSTARFDTWAYCAFSTDYSWAAGKKNAVIKATIAHELFHAVQFAYDYYEDRWFMEATATWAEDEVFDSANDNRQYLGASPLAQPWISLDRNEGLRPYGSWIFFRYLTERFPQAKAGLPTLMRRIWERADSTRGKDDASIHAVAHLLTKRKSSLAREWARFATANRRPGKSYAEGKHYDPAPLQQGWTLTSDAPSPGWQSTRLDHLTSSTYGYEPGAGLTKRWRLRVRLDLPRRAKAPAAAVVVHRTSGKIQRTIVKLNKAGNATVRVPFGAKQVSSVEVSLANASIAYTCWHQTTFSCQGIPRFDAGKWQARLRVRAVPPN